MERLEFAIKPFHGEVDTLKAVCNGEDDAREEGGIVCSKCYLICAHVVIDVSTT